MRHRGVVAWSDRAAGPGVVLEQTMNTMSMLGIAGAAIVATVSSGQNVPGVGIEPGIVPNEIVVQFDPVAVQIIGAVGELAAARTMIPTIDAVGLDLGVAEIRPQFPGAATVARNRPDLPDLSGWHVVRFDPRTATPEEAVARFAADPFVRSAETIGIHPLLATPNDGNYPSQWHLNNPSGADIGAPAGWDLQTGSPAITVAVLDSGVRYYHKDLGGAAASPSNPGATAGNIWINVAERDGIPGVDDDGNGYVDDWVGYDFVTGATQCWTGEDCDGIDNDPRDFDGHGTHCAGIVAAISNNGYAVASPAGGWGNGTLQSTADGVRIMSLRMGWSGNSFGQKVGYVRMDYAASAFYYAAVNGARIASCSWGSSNSGGIAAALDYFIGSGGLVFVAAGNANNQTAGYLNSRADCYSVAATDQTDRKASFSSYGTWVDISAPGVGILSTYHVWNDPAPDYVATLDGTSMATPLVASVAAAVWSANPSWTASQVWNQLVATSVDIDPLNPSFAGRLGAGRVDFAAAVAGGGGGGGCDPATCDDGDPCNGIETCVDGVCVPGSITDCNANGIDDGCELAGNDCNANGIPDDCDIAAGSADCNANGVPDECEGGDPCGGGGGGSVILMSFKANTAVPGLGTVRDEDIVAFDTATGTWSLHFDGSDVGLGGFQIDALAVLPSGDLLLSFTAAGTVGGLTGVDDSDIVRFVPTSLGNTTAGSFVRYFDGSDVGFSTNDEDIDALGILEDGSLILSTLGNGSAGGVSFTDEDLLRFVPTSLGGNTAGSLSMYFDGSDVGLTTNAEDIDAVSVLPSGLISLSTQGVFSVPGVSGRSEDLVDFSPTTLGGQTSGTFSMFFVGIDAGLAGTANIGSAEEIP